MVPKEASWRQIFQLTNVLLLLKIRTVFYRTWISTDGYKNKKIIKSKKRPTSTGNKNKYLMISYLLFIFCQQYLYNWLTCRVPRSCRGRRRRRLSGWTAWPTTTGLDNTGLLAASWAVWRSRPFWAGAAPKGAAPAPTPAPLIEIMKKSVKFNNTPKKKNLQNKCLNF